MIDLIKKILNNPIFKITSLNSVSVLLRILMGLISTSVVAKTLGPSGMALLGNLRNFLASLETLGTLGFSNGIVKYVAQYQEEPDKLKKISSTVFFAILGISVVLGILIFSSAQYWNDKLFGSQYQYTIVFQVLAITIPLQGLNVFLVALVNGLSQYKRVILINIFGNLLGFLFSIYLILQWELIGGLIAMVMVPGLLFFITLFFISKNIDLKQNISFNSIDTSVLKGMSSYSVMALFSAFLLPLVQLKIRSNAIDFVGISSAGNWEAVNRLSVFYMMFVSTLVSVYFFPQLSKASNNLQTRQVIRSYFKSILPLFLVGGLILLLIKDVVILILYSDQFSLVSGLIKWQLLGDFFKVASLILGYEFFAKKMTQQFLLTEAFSIVILFVSSQFLMRRYGVEGLVLAHVVTYFTYLLVLLWVFRKTLFVKLKP